LKFLFVLAHPEPASFTSALAHHGIDTLRKAGHIVDVADLYAMGFDPVSDRRNFIGQADSGRYDQQVEERHASAASGFSPDLQREMDRLAECDVLVLQFPIWWLGLVLGVAAQKWGPRRMLLTEAAFGVIGVLIFIVTNTRVKRSNLADS